MASVFRATDPRGRPVALKVLAAQARPERLARELRALGRLDHPHVVRLLGGSAEAEPPYVAMELVAGEDLAARLRRGPLPPAVAARLLAGVAEGLAHAHARGVVHRDLKPANVLIRAADDAALVADFGLARELDASRFTQTGALVGTLGYHAPEQLAGSRVDPPADVWSVGVCLYEALTGRLPFAGDSGLEVSRRVARADLTPLEPDEAPDDLRRTVLACLQADPAARPSAAEVARALRGRRGVGEPSGRGRRPALLAAAIVGAALVAAGAVVAVAAARRAPPAPAAGPAGAEAPGETAGPPWGPARAPWAPVWTLGGGAAPRLEPPGAWAGPGEAAPLRAAAGPAGARVSGFAGEAEALGGGRVRVRYGSADLEVEAQAHGRLLPRLPPAGLVARAPGALHLRAPNDSHGLVVRVGRARWAPDVRFAVRARRLAPGDRELLGFDLADAARTAHTFRIFGRRGTAGTVAARRPFRWGDGWHDVVVDVGAGFTVVDGELDSATAPGRSELGGPIALSVDEITLALAEVVVEGAPLRPDAPARAVVPGEVPGDARVAAAFARGASGWGGPFVALGVPGAEPLVLELDRDRLVLRRGRRELATTPVPDDLAAATTGWLRLERRGLHAAGVLELGGRRLTCAAADPRRRPGPLRASYGSTAPAVTFTAAELRAAPAAEPAPSVVAWREAAARLATLVELERLDPDLAGPGPGPAAARRRVAEVAAGTLGAVVDELPPRLQGDGLARLAVARVLAGDGDGATAAAEALVAREGVEAARARVDAVQPDALTGTPFSQDLLEGYTALGELDVKEAGLRFALRLRPDGAGLAYVGLARAIRERRPDPATAAGRRALQEALELCAEARRRGDDSVTLRTTLADTLLDLERPAEALPHLDEALAQGHEAWWVRRQRAAALLALGRTAEGAEELAAVLRTGRSSLAARSFVLQSAAALARAEPAVPGRAAAALAALAETESAARAAGLRAEVRALAEPVARAGRGREAALAAYALAVCGAEPPLLGPAARSGPAGVLARARAGDPEALAALPAAAAADPLVADLVALSPALDGE